jgi:hypothetical protein
LGRNAVKQGSAQPALVPAASPDVPNGIARKELIAGQEIGGLVAADINHRPRNGESPRFPYKYLTSNNKNRYA